MAGRVLKNMGITYTQLVELTINPEYLDNIQNTGRVEHMFTLALERDTAKNTLHICRVGTDIDKLRDLLALALEAMNDLLAVHPANDEGERYYIQDTRSYVGNCPMWWGENSQGYTCHLSRAGRYTRKEAEAICKNRTTEKAWPCSYVDSIASKMVDSQSMRGGHAINF